MKYRSKAHLVESSEQDRSGRWACPRCLRASTIGKAKPRHDASSTSSGGKPTFPTCHRFKLRRNLNRLRNDLCVDVIAPEVL